MPMLFPFRRSLPAWTVAAALVMAAVGAPAGAWPLVSVPQASDPIHIDAQNDEPAWRSAAQLTPFLLASSGQPAQEQTRLSLLASQTHLYILVHAHAFALDPASNMHDSFKAQVTQRDGDVWADDSLEMRFIVEHEGQSTVTYVAVNALGTLLDMRQTPAGWDKSWQGRIEAAGSQRPGHWTAELAIPWEELGLVGQPAGQQIRFNAVRFEHRLGEKSAWANLTDGNHQNHAHLGVLHITGKQLAVQPVTTTHEMTADHVELTLINGQDQRVDWRTELLQGQRIVASRTGSVTLPSDHHLLRMDYPPLPQGVSHAQARYVLGQRGKAIHLSRQFLYTKQVQRLTLDLQSSAPMSLYVNGKPIVTGQTEIREQHVPLQPGANVLSIRLPAGQPVQGTVQLPDETRLALDDTWRVGPADDDALLPQTDDTHWPRAAYVASNTSSGQAISSQPGQAGDVVLRKTVMHQVTHVYPRLPGEAWHLTEGGTYTLFWDGTGLPAWEIGRALPGFALTVDVPAGLQLVGAATRPTAQTTATAAGVPPREPGTSYRVQSMGRVTRHGRPYERHLIQRQDPVTLTAKRPSWLERRQRQFKGLWISVRPDAGTAGKTIAPLLLTAQAADGSYVETDNAINLVIHSPLQGRPPQHLRLMLNARDALVTNPAMEQGYLDTLHAAGVNEMFGETQSGHARSLGLEQTYFFNLSMSTRDGFESTHLLVDPIIRAHPEAQAIAYNGRRMPTPCLSYLARHDHVWPILEQQVALLVKMNPSLSQLFWDYEFPPFMDEGLHLYPMFSAFGIETFRQVYGIDEALTPPIIREKYADQWVAFTCGEVARVVERLADVAHRHGLSMTMYSGYHSDYTQKRYNVDWAKLAPHIDRAYAGYTDDQALIDITRTALNGKPLVGGLLLMGVTAQTHTPAQIVRKAVTHRGGVLLWYESRFDARALMAIAEASRLLAEYEAMILHGKRVEDRLVTDQAQQADVIAFEYQGRIAVMLFNDRASQPRGFELALPANAVAGPEFYTGQPSEIVDGKVTLTVPGGAVRALVIDLPTQSATRLGHSQ